MQRAYGESFIHSSGEDVTDIWFQYWKNVVKLQGRLYVLPGGAVGCHYVDLLSEEGSHLAVGHYPADRFIVFLHSCLKGLNDKKAADIRRVLERRMMI